MRKKENSLKRAAKGLARIQVPVLFLLCMMLVGVTAGFLVSTDSALNRLSCGHNTAGIVESYAPPASFAKGDEITKEVKVKNEGSVPCYVRVFAEVSDPEARDAIELNIDSSAWSEKSSDGYYYYRKVLPPGSTTAHLLKAVTALEDVNEFKIICYSETVQAEGFNNAQEAFAKIK